MVRYPWDVCQQAVILAVMKGICKAKLFGQTNKQTNKQTKQKQYLTSCTQRQNLTSNCMGNICLLPMQWVTEIKDVRCERKNHNMLTLGTLRKVTYRKWYHYFCDEACGFYIRPFMGVWLEHYHKYVAYSYHVTEVKFPTATPRNWTDFI